MNLRRARGVVSSLAERPIQCVRLTHELANAQRGPAEPPLIPTGEGSRLAEQLKKARDSFPGGRFKVTLHGVVFANFRRGFALASRSTKAQNDLRRRPHRPKLV
jgi:hypothetical protein